MYPRVLTTLTGPVSRGGIHEPLRRALVPVSYCSRWSSTSVPGRPFTSAQMDVIGVPLQCMCLRSIFAHSLSLRTPPPVVCLSHTHTRIRSELLLSHRDHIVASGNQSISRLSHSAGMKDLLTMYTSRPVALSCRDGDLPTPRPQHLLTVSLGSKPGVTVADACWITVPTVTPPPQIPPPGDLGNDDDDAIEFFTD